MMLHTVLADIRSQVDAHRNTGARFWIKVFGKALVTPAVHAVLLYRLGSVLYRWLPTRPFAFVIRGIGVVWSGTEIHPGAQIGPGLCLVHSQKIVIADGVRIGKNARISHGVSIGGHTGPHGLDLPGLPVIGDEVTIALDAIIIGPVTVGDGAFVSAQSIVMRDVAPRTVVAGAPARVVRRLDDSPPAGAPTDAEISLGE